MHGTGHVGPTLTPDKLLTKETRALGKVLNHGRLLLHANNEDNISKPLSQEYSAILGKRWY